MPKKCNACGRYANATEGVTCSECLGYHHRDCVNIPNDAKLISGWLCPSCKAQTPRKGNIDNPVRGEKADYASTSHQADTSCGTCAELLKEMRLINQNMMSFKNDIDTMKNDITVLRGVAESIGGRIDGMEMRLIGLEKRSSELQNIQNDAGVGDIISVIDQLKLQLNDRQQESFLNDLEISGIPEEQGENVVHIVGRIADKLGVAYEERDLVFVERIGMRRAPDDTTGNNASPTGAPRPRRLIVRVARRQLRDAFLGAARVRRGITTDGMGFATAPTRFFVNERLSNINRMLFFESRQQARTNGWRFVWTKNGRIFVSREAGRASFRVRSEKDIEKIFGCRTTDSRVSPPEAT